MSLAAVCFDLDDTLYPYREYARTGLLAAADRLEDRTGTSYHEDLLALYFDDGVTGGTFDRLVERHGLESTVNADDLARGDADDQASVDAGEDASLVDELVEAYHAATAPLSPYDETEAVLSRLTRRFDLGVITDGRGGRAKLHRLGIDHYFDAVVVSPDHDTTKHEQRVFERALSLLDGTPAETMYVGDDPRVDFRVPNRLGMDTVRLRRGRYIDLDPDGSVAAPDVEIESLDELVALVE